MSISASIQSPKVEETVTLTATVLNQFRGVIYSFEWTTGATTASIEIETQGTYTVKVTASDGTASFMRASSITVVYTASTTTETDSSGTTTTITENPDGSKETVIVDSDKTTTTRIESADGSSITTTVESSEGTSVTKETKTVIEDASAPTTISTTTVVVKNTEEKVTSAEAKVEVKVDKTSESATTVEITQNVVQAALNTISVEEESEEVQVTKTLTVAADTTQISLTADAAKAVSESSATLEFKGAEGTLTADADVVKTMASQNESLTLSFTKATESDLQEPQKEIVKDSTAYQLKLTKSDGTEVHKLNGTVNVSVQYELPSNVPSSEVVVIYVDDDGNMSAMDTKYESGTLSFTTDHFSCYMIGTKSMLEPTEPDVKPPIFIIIPDEGSDPVVIVDDQDFGSDDDSVKTIACVAAAVVVIAMLLFLVRDIRTK